MVLLPHDIYSYFFFSRVRFAYRSFFIVHAMTVNHTFFSFAGICKTAVANFIISTQLRHSRRRNSPSNLNTIFLLEFSRFFANVVVVAAVTGSSESIIQQLIKALIKLLHDKKREEINEK